MRYLENQLAEMKLDLSLERADNQRLKDLINSPPTEHDQIRAFSELLAETKSVKEKIRIIYRYGNMDIHPDFRRKVHYEYSVSRKMKTVPL